MNTSDLNNSDALDPDAICDIAVIGMAGRFPGARDIAAFWRNIRNGVETISFFSDEEMDLDYFSSNERDNPAFVKAKGILDDVELFDAPFFNMAAREAEWVDPQQRLFLECAWSALEDAGYSPRDYKGQIAVYAGVSTNTYILPRLGFIRDAGIPIDPFQVGLANEKDYIATRVSYKLNLRGESITVQTACSTSLVAIHLACQSLLSGQCDMALAGGASIRLPQKTGYLYQEGMIMSPDGHCRAFDQAAQGTVTGNGVGVVVLKMLSQALEDGDPIYAVVKGSAINNDGHLKAGFTAPSVEGQAEVISKALAIAGVSAETIGYVEAHGTGTVVGDPIEVEALTRAYRRHTSRNGFCALGSLKANMGHLDVAAGVAGFIKAVLALKHKEIPPLVHFDKPNAALNLETSPFSVPRSRLEWKAGPGARRAGVSAFGVGGTNAHVILEEAPPLAPSSASRPRTILTLSAKTQTALEKMASALSDFLENNPDASIADVAYTRNLGREVCSHKQFVVAASASEMIEALRAAKPANARPEAESTKGDGVAFMFPGQGTQAISMASGLYEHEPAFSQQVDECAQISKRMTGVDLREIIYPSARCREEAAVQLSRPEFTLPSLFAIEYAMARLWMSWGIHPKAMIGHSHGEYVAACVAGVFSLEDALSLAVIRGRLFQHLPQGLMLAVRLSEDQLYDLLPSDISIASINGKANCVVAGATSDIQAFEQELQQRHIGHRRLGAPYAYHSEMIDPILAEYKNAVSKMRLSAPALGYISSVTGTWIKDQEATDPEYWASQMRQCVRFAAGLDTLKPQCKVFLEVGPGQTLSSIAKQHFGRTSDALVLSSLSVSQARQPDEEAILDALGSMWKAGINPDWAQFYSREHRYRLHLPTYPFERKRYWIDAPEPSTDEATRAIQKPVIPQAPELDAREHDASISNLSAALAAERPEMAQPYVAPENELEKKLSSIWGEVLGISGIGIHDNYFDLGGDSLMATQIFTRIKQAFNMNISLKQVLSYPTIAGFCEALSNDAAFAQEEAESFSRSIKPAPRGANFKMAFSQRRLWFIQQSAPESSIYNLGNIIRIKGALDVAVLERCLTEIIRRHEALRAGFVIVNGEPMQFIAPPMSLQLPLVDLSELPTADKENEVRLLADENVLRPFDLTCAPLMRMKLLKMGNDEYITLFCIHHIVCDGWSFTILLREVAALYESYIAGKPSPLSELPIQYADFACWQSELLESGHLDSQLEYWRQQLGGRLPSLILRSDRPRPEAPSYKGATYSFAFPPGPTHEFKQLGRQQGATMFMSLLAALNLLLYKSAGQHDIIIGTPIAGRSRVETEGLIGLFLNTLALRTDMSGNPTFAELLGRVRRTTLDAYEHQDAPFEKLVEILQPERSLSQNPIFRVLFNFENIPVQPLAASNLVLTPMAFDNHATGLDLIWNLVEADDGLRGALQYNTDLFDSSTIAQMAGHFQSLLYDIISRPDSHLDELNMLTDEEKKNRKAEDEAREQFSRRSLGKVRRKPISTPEEPQKEWPDIA